MSFLSRLTATCTISEETVTTDDIGQEIRSFSNEVSVDCKLDPYGRGIREDLQLGRIIEDNRFTLFLGPDIEISTSHKVMQDGIDYKVDRVRKFYTGNGSLHHYECDLQEIE